MLNNYKKKQKKYLAKIQILKQKAKSLLQDGKSKETKKVLAQINNYNKHLQTLALRKKIVQDSNMRLQIQYTNEEIVEVLSAANQIKFQGLNQKFTQQLQIINQNKAYQQIINNQMKELINNDSQQEAAEEMLQELQRQIKIENKRKIEKAAIRVDIKHANRQSNKHNKSIAGNIAFQ